MRRRPAAGAGILPPWPIWRARGDSRTPAEPIVKHIGIWCTSKDWVDFERKTKTGAIDTLAEAGFETDILRGSADVVQERQQELQGARHRR
jgi:hypothetical protein